MTSYTVHVYNKIGKAYQKNSSTACWLGMTKCVGETIYITNFRRKETEKYISTLVEIINEITPCSLVKISADKEAIEFQMFDSYDRSLVLLNFIRNLWWAQQDFNYKKFFNYLESSNDADPLVKLTKANIEGCVKVPGYYSNHSNCFNSKILKVKTVKDLAKFGNKTNTPGALRTFFTV